MNKMIKKISSWLLFSSVTTFATGQNNAIFKGGFADGWNSKNSIQASTNIYKGSIADGWASLNFSQSTTNIFKGGIADGWDSRNYIQSSTTIFKGGRGDGWDSKNYIQLSLGIYKGGIGDGWASTYRPVGTLPVTLLNFTAQKQGNNATLVQWKTSSEINSHYFDLERSNDAINFQFIGKVNAAGNSSREISYSFTDNQPMKGENYYRLKQVDINGHLVYSPARFVRFDEINGGLVKYYPNPTSGILNIEITPQMQQGAMVINISNAAGAVMDQIKRPSNSTTILMIDMKRFAKGTYFIQVKTNSTNSTQRIVLQ